MTYTTRAKFPVICISLVYLLADASMVHLKPTLALVTGFDLSATGTIVHNVHRRECVKFDVQILSGSRDVANSLGINAEIALVKM